MGYDNNDLNNYTDKVKVNIIKKDGNYEDREQAHLRQKDEMENITNRDKKYINENPESHNLDDQVKIDESITDTENVRNLIDRDRRLDQK